MSQLFVIQKFVYTTNSTAKLPKFDKKVGDGGNAQVFKCCVTTPNGTELFACKVEKKVTSYFIIVVIYVLAVL